MLLFLRLSSAQPFDKRSGLHAVSHTMTSGRLYYPTADEKSTYSNQHDHSTWDAVGLSEMIMTVGPDTFKTRHLDYQFVKKNDQGGTDKVKDAQITFPAKALTLVERAKHVQAQMRAYEGGAWYLVYLETAWLDTIMPNWSFSPRHSAPVEDSDELTWRRIDLNARRSLRSGIDDVFQNSVWLPPPKVVNGTTYYLNYRVLVHELPVTFSTDLLTEDAEFPTLYHMQGLSSVMSQVVGLGIDESVAMPTFVSDASVKKGRYFRTRSEFRETKQSFFHDSTGLYAAYTTNSTVMPIFDTALPDVPERWTMAMPLEVVYRHQYTEWNPCQHNLMPHRLAGSPVGLYDEAPFNGRCHPSHVPGTDPLYGMGIRLKTSADVRTRFALVRPATTSSSRARENLRADYHHPDTEYTDTVYNDNFVWHGVVMSLLLWCLLLIAVPFGILYMQRK